MIFYFSATGNSKYAAMKLAAGLNEETMDITRCLESGTFHFQLRRQERLGFVSPTYVWRLPANVETFLKNLVVEAPAPFYCFWISTYGSTSGEAGYFAKRILKKRNVSLQARFDIQMPDTWTPFFDLSDPQKNARRNAAAEEEMGTILSQIQNRAEGNFMHRRVPPFPDAITRGIYSLLRRTSHFHVTDSCIGCGRCAAKCPAHVIRMEKGRPVWTQSACLMCLGCLHRCPVFAIQYGASTRKHGQYVHPGVDL